MYSTVTKIFRPLIGRTMEVYIDDMLIKTKERPDHTKHLQETFELLHTNGMKLNPLKCAFRVSSSKFLGFMVTQRGIEANPIQLRAIMESQTPSNRKEESEKAKMKKEEEKEKVKIRGRGRRENQRQKRICINPLEISLPLNFVPWSSQP